MPWKVASAMSQREELVALAQSEGVNMSELCLRSGISRKTGYKWLSRYLEAGEQSLDDLPERPHNSPNRTGAEMEQLVVDLRSEHPTKGGHVLARMLKDSGHYGVPSKSTVTAILRRHRLIEPADSLKHKPYRRFEHQRPNDLWQMDFKGHIPVGSGGRCHPLTVLDDHSRFSLGVRACADEKTQTVHDHLTSIFRRYGMPDTILVDNGSPWGSDFYHRFTRSPSGWCSWESGWYTAGHNIPRPSARSSAWTGPSRRNSSREVNTPTCPTARAASTGGETSTTSRVLTTPWTSIPLPADTPSALGLSRRPFRPSSTIPMTRYAPSMSTAEYPFWAVSLPVGKAFRNRRVALRPTAKDGTWKVFFVRTTHRYH